MKVKRPIEVTRSSLVLAQEIDFNLDTLYWTGEFT